MSLSERERVARWALAHLPTITAAIMESLQDRVAAYRGMDRQQLAEVGRIAGWVLTRTLELWVKDAHLGEDDLARFRSFGAARASDGRPLPGVLRAYRVAATVTTEQLMTMAGARIDVADLVALNRLWMESLDEISAALYSGYTAAAQPTPDQGRVVRNLLDDLVAGRDSGTDSIVARFGRLGLQPPPDPYIAVIATTDGGPPPDVALTELAGDPPFATCRCDRGVLLLDGPDRHALGQELRRRTLHGACVRAETLEQIANAYRLADDAVQTAPPLAYGRTGLLSDGDAHVLGLIAGRGTTGAAQVAHLVLGSLTGPRQAHLLEGLTAVIENGSATAAAERTGLHPQTVRYRLRRVEQVTGRTIYDGWDRLCLAVAVQAQRAARALSEP